MALGAPWQQQVTVLDEQGNDVTPRPLLAVTPRAAPGGEKATGSARQSTVDLTAASGKLNSSVLGQTSLKVPVNQVAFLVLYFLQVELLSRYHVLYTEIHH